MIIKAVPRQPIDTDTFADITTVPVTDIQWVEDGLLAVTFESDLTPAQQAAVKIRMESRNATEELLRTQAIAAMQTNIVFLTVVTPTNAQIVAQTKALTRQSNGVIQMLLGQLDAPV